MSTHDRGAFGELLAKVMDRGFDEVDFKCHLDRDAENDARWIVIVSKPFDGYVAHVSTASGRTGEEALRRLVERLGPA